LIGPIFGFFAIDTQEQVKVIVHGAKATDGDRKDLVQFFESLVDPIFPLETVLIGKQMGFPAASGKAVIPTTYGRIDQSAASFSHRKSPLRNIRFSPQNLPNCKTNAICCACPFLFLSIQILTLPPRLQGGGGRRSYSTAADAPSIAVPGGLPAGSKVVRSGRSWHVLEHSDGSRTIRFRSRDALTNGSPRRGGYSGTDDTAAFIDPNGNVYVTEGQHRLAASAIDGKSTISSVPGADGYLEYSFHGNTQSIGTPPAYNNWTQPQNQNPWEGLEGY